MLLSRFCVFSVAFIFFLMASPLEAKTVFCVNCSTSIMQLMDRVTNLSQLSTALDQYVENVSQTEQQIRMVQQNIEQYSNMLQNTKSLNPEALLQLQGEYRRLGNLYNEIETRSGDIGAMRKAYEDLYPSFGQVTEGAYTQKQAQWSQEVDRSNSTVFQQTGRQLKDLQQADTFDRRVNELLNNPKGRMEAIQATNQLNAMQLQEARELRALLATALQAQATSSAKQEKIEQARQEQYEELFKPREKKVNPENAKNYDPYK